MYNQQLPPMPHRQNLSAPNGTPIAQQQMPQFNYAAPENYQQSALGAALMDAGAMAGKRIHQSRQTAQEGMPLDLGQHRKPALQRSLAGMGRALWGGGQG